jgi:chloramphenicol-sensitive protein RarD
MNKGTLTAAAAYICWGFFPIYWKLLSEVSALEILASRMTWSLLFLLGILAYRRHWGWIRTAVHDRKIMLTFLGSAVLLSVNWFTYIWAVNAGFIIETSLGYFINPLVNVLLGVVLLKEKLRPIQLLAVLIALGGVLYLTISYGALPWIALTLAFSFGFYGLLRKTASLGSLEGLSMETGLLFLPALGYLLYLQFNGTAAFGHSDLRTTLLLAFAGIATAVPLLLFATGARQITLISLGILQYIAPTIQFLLGVLVYKEPFDTQRLIGFALVWLALIIYTAEALFRARQSRRAKITQVPIT